MADLTEHYGFQVLAAGDDWSLNGYKFLDADRRHLDALLYQALSHTHGAATAAQADPTAAPTLVQAATGGALPAGTRIYYKFTWVDGNGLETAPSPEAYVDTPAALADPAAPTLVQATTGGFLLPGNYSYVLSAYKGANTAESRAPNAAFITVPTGTSTNEITLTMPSVPTGADGFNVYRRKPGGSQYQYLGSVLAATTTFVDDGTHVEDCDRTLPVSNTTNASNKVTATVPTVPAGYTWRLYRTYVLAQYASSLLHWVVEETSEGSGVITPDYEDVGYATLAGQPPASSQLQVGPGKINLTLGDEVEGRLPLGFLDAAPLELVFSFAGLVLGTVGSFVWVCPYPALKILSARLSLGRGRAPASLPILIDINKGTGLSPTYTTIFTTQANRPTIAVGNQIGAASAAPDVPDLVAGDSLTVDIDQAGGGASPTDYDLTVTIYALARYTGTASVWPA